MEQSPSSEANWFCSQSRNPPAFYGTTRKFITVLTSSRHLSLSCANSIQHPQPLRSILILYSHLLLGLPNGLFPSGFPTNTLCTPLPSSIHATCLAHLIILDFISRKTLGEQYRSLSFSLCNFLYSPVTPSLLGPKILLKHPQPMLLPQWQRPRFTPIQNNGINYSSVYFERWINKLIN
jgi:hypothetical protein